MQLAFIPDAMPVAPRKYQVFISSTFTDLIEERRSVTEVILGMGHVPVGMELFEAVTRTSGPISATGSAKLTTTW
jgi:hypothetical protein